MLVTRAFVAASAVGFMVVACGGKIEGEGGDGTPGSTSSSAPGVLAPNACEKPCPNDPAPPASAVDQCKRGEDPSGAACRNEYVALVNCAAGKVVCKEGKTDPQASAEALIGACTGAILAYQGCVSKGFDAGGLRPPG